MTNQEWLQQNNAKIEAMRQKLEHKVGANGTIEITENGKYDVAGYSDANVNVPVPNLSQTTAKAEDVFEGKQFYNADGELVVGGYKDIMNRYLAVKKSCASLFQNFTDEDMSWVGNLNTSGVSSMSSMFRYCRNATKIDVGSFDTHDVKDMSRMFDDCMQLNELDLSNFHTPNVTTMNDMFLNCEKLTKLDLSNFNTSNVVSIYNLFGNCKQLKNIIGEIDLINANNISNMFYYCNLLEDVTLKNIKLSLQLGSGASYGTKLTNESIINTIQELWDNTDNALGGSRTLTLSTTSKKNISNIYVKLIDVTDEMRAEDEYIDNKKPCVVCDSTDEGAMTLTEYLISKNWSLA